MRGERTPAYALADFQGALRDGRYRITRGALEGDVYRCRFGRFSIYTKLQLSAVGHAVIISFKRDESA